jgi:hypothetical protein
MDLGRPCFGSGSARTFSAPAYAIYDHFRFTGSALVWLKFNPFSGKWSILNRQASFGSLSLFIMLTVWQRLFQLKYPL